MDAIQHVKVPDIIRSLVDRFERNLSDYQSQGYKEDQLRQEFINPFFEALGWDISNKSGAAPAYRDVIHEDSIKMAGGTKAPDYCFTLSGQRMFFVETKKPSVDVSKDPKPAYQLRRYAWSAQLPVSILTNFESFIVYDSRQKPKESDKVTTGKIQLYSFREYVEKWEEIANTFSKTAILQGSFDKFIDAAKLKRGTQEVGDEFLKEIEGWRDALARNIAIRNPQLSVPELNQAVQGTIDRIIFLRMCEDRGIERYGQLQSLLQQENIYKQLGKIYQKADEKYNSGLFHFKNEKGRSPPDELTLQLTIDDKVLETIIKNLYYPESPYEFSVLRPEILGYVYEQFLGKIIRLTEGHHAKIEEKPEVKKAGGVYYTPEYIVIYIVENTVGKLCEGKTPIQIEKLHILDPACGSGSFLLGAYSYLLAYHLDYYSKQKNPKRYKDQIFQGKDGQWFLRIKEKKRILLNNIFGVDIDSQAVEVTKLSLLLKVLEGANRDILEQQQKLWTERVLPDLNNNIKCGNSLVESDYFSKSTEINSERIVKMNVFDWNKEFPSIISSGGFDSVIGNPPYVRQETLGELKSYLKNKYETYHGIADLYVYFIERGISLLTEGGIFSFIVANKWLRTKYGAPLRSWLERKNLEEIIDFGDLPVFQKATTYPCIIRVSKEKIKSTISLTKIKTLDFKSLQSYVEKEHVLLKKENLKESNWSLTDKKTQNLIKKLSETGTALEKMTDGKIFRGILTGLNEAFVIDEETKNQIIRQNPSSSILIKPFLQGRNIKRYSPLSPDNYLILIPSGWTKKQASGTDPWQWLKGNHPKIAQYLEPFEEAAKRRYDKGEHWWELRSCDYYNEFEKNKIIFPNICKRPEFTYDSNKNYTNQKCYIIPTDEKYLVGILNSSLTNFLFNQFLPKLRGGFFEPNYNVFKNFPIYNLSESREKDRAIKEKINTIVDKLMSLNKLGNETNTENEKNTFSRQIDSLNKELDELIYRLYGLSTEEIEIIEKVNIN